MQLSSLNCKNCMQWTELRQSRGKSLISFRTPCWKSQKSHRKVTKNHRNHKKSQKSQRNPMISWNQKISCTFSGSDFPLDVSSRGFKTSYTTIFRYCLHVYLTILMITWLIIWHYLFCFFMQNEMLFLFVLDWKGTRWSATNQSVYALLYSMQKSWKQFSGRSHMLIGVETFCCVFSTAFPLL